MKNSFIFSLLFLVSHGIFAQDLSGKWVETIRDDAINAYAEINILSQRYSEINGYSFDVTVDAPSRNFTGRTITDGRCSFEFQGTYDYDNKFLDITSNKQVFRTPDHAPGRWLLVYSKEGDTEYLTGKIIPYDALPYTKGYSKLKSLVHTNSRNMSYVNNEYIGDPNYGAGDYYTVVRYKKVPEDYEIEDSEFKELASKSPLPEEYINTTVDKNVLLGRTSENYFSNDELDNIQETGTITYFPRPEEPIEDPDNELGEENIPIASANVPTLLEEEEVPEPTELTDPDNEIIEAPIPSLPEYDSSTVETEEVNQASTIEESEIDEVVAIPDTEVTPVAPETPDESLVETETIEESPEEEIYEQAPITEQQKVEIEEKYASRRTKVLANIRTQDKVMKMVVKDYGEQDGDLISIIIDGKVIYRKLPITTLQKNLEIVLESDRRQNEIIFVAENLGRVPPNTARIEIFLNDKKYSYSLLTDTSNNAKIVLQRD